MKSRFFWILLGIIVMVATSSDPQDNWVAHATTEWAKFSPGSIVYSAVVSPPDFLYLEPDTKVDAALKIENRHLYGEAINVSERYLFLNVSNQIRIRVIDHEWGQILPEPDSANPYISDGRPYPVYVQLQNLEPLDESHFAPFSVFADTQPVDKLLVILHDGIAPKLIAYEGEQVVLTVPVVLGPTPVGDFRIWRKQVSDDMPGIPGVPNSACFTGGYCIHGSFWWNWAETVKGHYGSHGCVNLPDSEWYVPQLGDRTVSIDEWVYRWTETNLGYDESDPTTDRAVLHSADPEWYQATKGLRVVVVNSIEELNNIPTPVRLGELAQNAQVTDFRPLIDNYYALNDQWLLTHIDQSGAVSQTLIDSSRSIKQIAGTSESQTWVMLTCDDRSLWDQPAAENASRTVGEICQHFATDRPGSVCTPERVDTWNFGQRVYCLEDKFNLLDIGTRGELIEHEKVHLTQFGSPLAALLLAQGVATDDLSPGYVDYQQLSLGGVLEFGAQAVNQQSYISHFYGFVLADYDQHQEYVMVDSNATVAETWQFLHATCGDSSGQDPTVHELISRGILLDPTAYEELEQRCGLPLHRLIPDYVRNG